MRTCGHPISVYFVGLYRLSEAKVILRALERLRTSPASDSPLSAERMARRAFCAAFVKAASDLDIAVKTQVTMLTWAPDTKGAKEIEEAYRQFYDSDAEIVDANEHQPTTRNLLHAHWRLLGASQTPGWREPLKRLRHSRTSLRKALKAHPSIRYALRHGLLLSGMARQFGRRWLHVLADSPETLAEVAGLALDDDGLTEPRGRPAYRELVTFVARVMTAAETYSGNSVTASDHKDRRSKTDGITRRTSPGVLLVYACVKPLYPSATLENCAGLIRRVKASTKPAAARK